MSVRKGTRVICLKDTPLNPPVNGGRGNSSYIIGDTNNLKYTMNNSPSPFTGRVGVGFSPIKLITPGTLIFSYDEHYYKAIRIIKKRFTGKIIGIQHQCSAHTLWLTNDHKVLIKNRTYSFSNKRDWSHNLPETFEKARKLRKRLTNPEQKLWSRLKGKQHNVKFRKQHPIGPYIVDFYCPERALIIEVDGNDHFSKDGMEYDASRTDYLSASGLSIIRFKNAEIDENIDVVNKKISGIVGEKVKGFKETVIWIDAEYLKIGDIVYFGKELESVQITNIQAEETDEDVYDLEICNTDSLITEVCVVHNN